MEVRQKYGHTYMPRPYTASYASASNHPGSMPNTLSATTAGGFDRPNPVNSLHSAPRLHKSEIGDRR